MAGLTAYQKFLQVALRYAFSLFGTAKTEQTTSYVNYDDGYYLKGYPKAGERFTDNGDGTITDNATGLMWVADPSELGGNWGTPGTPLIMTWANAITECEALDYAGHTDWRLPNAKELLSIIDYERSSPAMNTAYFSNIQAAGYWSSTTYKVTTANAWGISAAVGSISNIIKTATTIYAIPVRG